MRQMTLAHQAEFQRDSKKTPREQLLKEMDAVMSSAGLLALVAPHYSKDEMAASLWARDHVAGLLSAAAVRVVGSRGGRCAV